jgi:hypothetical protein
MHIVGLVWSGGYGVQRKVAGSEQVLRSASEVRHGPDGSGRRCSPSSAGCCSWWWCGRRCGKVEPDDPFSAPVAAAGVHAGRGVFNRAFGDKLNPLYHLGPLTFYLFWIVGGTGLYLYAFFDTSVVGAYRSVESLTHDQWFAGGIVRSVHRYASDAMVVTMLIHLLRYWAFDRLRGFSWFSWVTGVVLLWLVFAAGVNGYMLPWDRLAQFVTQASFEWMDWLPGFGGSLIRNFIYDHSVSDRLFSLLVFIHIGVPLFTLLLMWVHVQRVPKATTQPPRPIALSVAAMLVLLALVQPVMSQGGPARLAVAPTVLSFDWFLLALYPLGLRLAGGGGVGARAGGQRPADARALAAAASRWPGRGPSPDTASRPGVRTRARRRDAARSGPARRIDAALRLPRRRLRPVCLQRAERPCRSWQLPTRGADGGDARARPDPDVLRHGA